MIRVLSLALFPALLVVFSAIYVVDRPAYLRALVEDSAVEYATVLFLLIAMALSLFKATRISRTRPFARWFYVAFSAFCLFAVLEELSWGQRIVGFRSPEFFLKHARQGETNVHNVMERLTKLTTKDYAAAAFLLYGVCLPIAVSRSRRVKAFVDLIGLKVPPLFLILGFALAALLQLDRPTGREEEIGELFFSLCASLFMLNEVVDDTARGP